MLNNYKLFLYKFDLIGINPHLYVFNQRSYNSIISSIISFLILLFSIIFVIYSFVKYLKFDNPSISYTKDNEQYTERKINLKDILMFQVFETKSFKTLNKSDISFEAELIVSYFNGTTLNIPLDSEICELGKNIDINVGFRNITEDLKKYQEN